MNIQTVTDGQQLDHFYEDWSLTFEGLDTSEENISFIKEYLDHYGGEINPDFTAWVVPGSLMNEHYSLTGDNAYPDDLHIVVIEQKDIGNVHAIAMPRFQIGGRWFTDIVDNNARREEEKRA